MSDERNETETQLPVALDDPRGGLFIASAHDAKAVHVDDMTDAEREALHIPPRERAAEDTEPTSGSTSESVESALIDQEQHDV